MKLLIIILLLLLALTFLYFNKQIILLKNKMIILINQNNILKTKLYIHTKNNIFIQFFKPKYQIGILPKNSSLKLAPLNSSCNITTLSCDTEVLILDMALIDNLCWYYISIPSKNNINSHGWIQENSFLNLFSKVENNIIKK